MAITKVSSELIKDNSITMDKMHTGVVLTTSQGLHNNANDTVFPTAGAVAAYVTSQVTGANNWDLSFAWGDHSTYGYATETYVDNSIANVINSAPAALDTLNELAAALGDDPNFATTVTNLIAGKQAAGTYNTIIGTDTDINTSGATIVDNIYVTDGVITSMGTRTLTLGDLGYTGATNANYITNNNQLTNGADYISIGSTILHEASWTTATKFKSGGDIDQNAGNHSLQIYSDTNNDAFMAFHISGDYAVHFGLDNTSNRLYVGGWSDPSKYQIWDSRDFSSTDISNWNTAYSKLDMHFGTETQNIDTYDQDAFWATSKSTGGLGTYPGNYYNIYNFAGNGLSKGTQLATYYGSNNKTYIRSRNDNNNSWLAWEQVWTAGTDGSGSGLDADLLDGLQGSQFLRSDASDVMSGNLNLYDGNLWIQGDTSNKASISLSESTVDKHLVLEYNGTGGGAGNYFSMHSEVAGWVSQGAGFNYIPQNGRVGIGTTTPTQALDVAGNVTANVYYDRQNTSYYLDPDNATTSANLLGDIKVNGGKIHIKRGVGLTTTIIEDDSTASGRGQLLLDSHYSDLIVASRNSNTNKHGSSITLATQSTSTNDYAKWVIGQGQYQEGADELAFAYGTNFTNPHSVLGTDNANAAFRIFAASGGYTLSKGSSRAPIFYDSNNTGYYTNPEGTSRLNVLNANAVGTSVAGIGKVLFPYGAEYNGNNTVTGAFKITLPNSWTNTMMSMKIVIFDYSSNESFEISCGGYNYAGGAGYWTNTHAKIIAHGIADRNFNIRFGHDGTKCCIYIGETNSSWAYPKVVVTEWIGGHSNETFTNWDNGWSIAAVTSLGTITETQSNSQIGRYQSIIYDSNNTGYYVNPAGANRLHSIVVGDGTPDTTPNGTTFSNTIKSTNGSNRVVNFEGAGTSISTWYTVGNTAYGAIDQNDSYMAFWQNHGLGWSEQFRIYRGYQTSLNSLRAPIFYDSANTAYYLDPSNTGDSIRVAGDIVAYYSDERLKDIKGNIENAVDKVKQLNGFYYSANETAQKLGYKVKDEVGVSAQEVEKVLPEIIKDAPIGHGYKTLDYSKMVPLLIEAIKEQQTQIDELKQLINKQ